jgi:hypothetical protein
MQIFKIILCLRTEKFMDSNLDLFYSTLNIICIRFSFIISFLTNVFIDWYHIEKGSLQLLFLLGFVLKYKVSKNILLKTT